MNRRIIAGAVAAAVIASLTACSSSGSPGVPHAPNSVHLPSGPTNPSGGASTSAAGATSRISVRYANFFTTKQHAGPAIDLYEGQTGEPGRLLVKDLAYGAVSDYVHPHLAPGQSGGTAGLVTLPVYAIPTGEDPVKQNSDVASLTQLIDDGSHPQLTMLLQGGDVSGLPGPLAGLSYSHRLEKGRFNGETTPDIPPPGTTEFLADDTSVTASPNLITSAYLMITPPGASAPSCTAAANGDPNQKNLPAIFAADGADPKSSFAVFPENAGDYSLAVATTDVAANLTCTQLTQVQGTTSGSLAGSQQVEVYVYGTSATDLHLVVAPVQA